MPRGVYRRKTTVSVPVDTEPVTNDVVIPKGNLAAQKWMVKFTESDATGAAIVAKEDAELSHELEVNGRSRLAIGKHLEAIRARLEPHGIFGRYLKYKNIKRTIAYRRMNEYKNSSANLPESVVTAAMARNINILGESPDRPLGVYTDAVATLPPPSNPTIEQADAYLTQLENVRKQMKSDVTVNFDIPPTDPRVITKAIFKFADNQLRKIDNPKTRQQVLVQVVGMLFKKYEQPAMTVTPRPIPEDFTVARGRPRETVAVA